MKSSRRRHEPEPLASGLLEKFPDLRQRPSTEEKKTRHYNLVLVDLQKAIEDSEKTKTFDTLMQNLKALKDLEQIPQEAAETFFQRPEIAGRIFALAREASGEMRAASLITAHIIPFIHQKWPRFDISLIHIALLSANKEHIAEEVRRDATPWYISEMWKLLESNQDIESVKRQLESIKQRINGGLKTPEDNQQYQTKIGEFFRNDAVMNKLAEKIAQAENKENNKPKKIADFMSYVFGYTPLDLCVKLNRAYHNVSSVSPLKPF